MSKNIHFTCPKCGNTSYETGEIRTTGGFFSKLLDLQNKKFTHVTCNVVNIQNSTRQTAACLGTFSTCLHKAEPKIE